MDILDIFIGLVSVYLTLSLIVTALGEGISALFHFKSATAQKIVTSLVGEILQEAFYKHPAIVRLSQSKKWWGIGGVRKPSYIPPGVFADTLVEIVLSPHPKSEHVPASTAPPGACDQVCTWLTNLINRIKRKPADAKNKSEQETKLETDQTWSAAGGASMTTPGAIDRALTKLTNGPKPKDPKEKSEWETYQTLLGMWSAAGGDVTAFKQELIDWFDTTADRSYGWYRRRLGGWVFVAACAVVLALNADTIQIYERISSDETLRASLVKKASEIAGKGGSNTSPVDCALVGLKDGCKKQDFVREAVAELLPVVGGQTLYAEWKQHFAREAVAASLPAVGGQTLDAERKQQVDSYLWLLLKLIGLFLTATAISLGAPFWFDLLKKVAQIRGAIGTGTTAASTADTAKAIPQGEQPAPAALATIKADQAEAADLETLEGFEHTRYGYSRLNLFWNARLSALSYTSKDEAEATCTEEFGAQSIQLKHKGSDTQCLLVTTNKCAIIAFRGSEMNLEDWATNLDVALRKPSWDPNAAYRVHTGFDKALEAIWKQLYNELKGRVLSHNLPIWLTGHSLGGALATLAALRLHDELLKHGTGATIAGLHTFGQPRVGDTACARALDAQFGKRYFRAINQRDVVPRIPLPKTPDTIQKVIKGGELKTYDYAHTGRVIYFNDLGRAIMDPPIWYRKWDVLAVAPNKAALIDALKQTVADHDIKAYIRAHRDLLIT